MLRVFIRGVTVVRNFCIAGSCGQLWYLQPVTATGGRRGHASGTVGQGSKSQGRPGVQNQRFSRGLKSKKQRKVTKPCDSHHRTSWELQVSTRDEVENFCGNRWNDWVKMFGIYWLTQTFIGYNKYYNKLVRWVSTAKRIKEQLGMFL